MVTKAELQAENETLRGLVGDQYTVTNSMFHVGVSKQHARAVTELAKAVQEAAKALQGNGTGLSLGAKNYGSDE